MNVLLTDELKDLVRKKIRDGQFPTEEAVIEEALKRYRDQDERRRTARTQEPHSANSRHFAACRSALMRPGSILSSSSDHSSANKPAAEAIHRDIWTASASTPHAAVTEFSFLRPDRNQAAKPLNVMESHAGYQSFQEQLNQSHKQHLDAHFHVRIDAAGQYAAKLEAFLRGSTVTPPSWMT